MNRLNKERNNKWMTKKKKKRTKKGINKRKEKKSKINKWIKKLSLLYDEEVELGGKVSTKVR